jgi:hypothetical protein
MKMEQTECSETSAYKIQTPGNYPEENTQHTEHGESKLRKTYYFTLFTYLLTPWSMVLLEKLTGLQLVKKFPAFCGTQRFITALTSSRHLSLF